MPRTRFKGQILSVFSNVKYPDVILDAKLNGRVNVEL